MKKTFAVFLFVPLVASFVACTNVKVSPSPAVAVTQAKPTLQPSPSADAKNIPIVSRSPQFSKTYDKLDLLKKDSDTVIEGTVLDASYYDEKNDTFTKSHVKVDKSLQGDSKAGDTITVVELGGITNTSNGKVNISYFVPSLAPGEIVILFLKKWTNQSSLSFISPSDTFYMSLEGFQGKFFISNGTAERRGTYVSSLKSNLTDIEKMFQ